MGMSADGIAVAMQPFGQVDNGLDRKYEGTGLGIPLTKTLVEHHGGTFTIESEPGKGTTVTFTLPPARVVLPTDAATSAAL
jgi:signal transduction histidine kinase